MDDNLIQYSSSPKGVLVHLGFLQVNHRYEVELKLPVQHLSSQIDIKKMHLLEDEIPNLNCRLIDQMGIKDGYLNLKFNFFASKETLLKENCILVNECQPNEKIRLIVSARVLGRGKGIFLIKRNVHF